MLPDPLQIQGAVTVTATGTPADLTLVKVTPDYREYRHESESGSPLMRNTTLMRIAQHEMSGGRRRVAVTYRNTWTDLDNNVQYPYSQVNFSFIRNGDDRYEGEDDNLVNVIRILAWRLSNTEATPSGYLSRIIDGEM